MYSFHLPYPLNLLEKLLWGIALSIPLNWRECKWGIVLFSRKAASNQNNEKWHFSLIMSLFKNLVKTPPGVRFVDWRNYIG
jgi:hypothetical protein